MDGDYYKAAAKRLARAIVRFERNDYQRVHTESTFRFALRILKETKTPRFPKPKKFKSRPLTLAELAAGACTCDGGNTLCRACCAEREIKRLGQKA